MENRQAKARRTLILLALVCLAPVVASYIAYYWIRPSGRMNYGELIEPQPAPDVAGTTLDGAPFKLSDLRGRWVILTVDPTCEDACRDKLYATRQARLMQGREQERIVRVWLRPSDAKVDPALVTEQPGLVVVKTDVASPHQSADGEVTPSEIRVIDPLGNNVMRYATKPDIKGLARDLGRLLQASRIG